MKSETWKKFKKNKVSLFSLYFIILTVIVSILGYLITPDSAPDANTQLLQLAVKPPGFRVKMLAVKENREVKKVSIINKMLFGQENQERLIPIYSDTVKNDTVFAELYTGNIPNNGQLIKMAETGHALSLQTKTFLLGTDQEGRDMLSRLMIGTRVSLSVGFIAVLISLTIGIVLGATAGYYKGKWDSFVMWLISVMWSLPTLLLVISISLALGKGFWQIFIAVGLTMWIDVARIVRGQVFSIREETYIEAGRALGFSDTRIIFKHILPNITGTITVVAADNFATAILLEAGLSFLGIGAQPPTASWGAMINANRGFIITDSAYLAFLPGICIMLLVLAFFLVGNGLRDAMDIKGEASKLVGA